MAPGEAGGTAKNGSFSSTFAAVTPATHAQEVATKAVPTIAVGSFAPCAAKIANAVVGINWMELVLIARKVHIALVAVPGRGLSFSSKAIARKPSGVAALPKPSMFAAMFMTIAPMAGWSRGNVGKQDPQHRTKCPREHLDQAGAFREPHDPQPDRPRADQRQRDVHDGGPRAGERAVRHLLEGPVVPAQQDGDQDQGEPDVVKHRRRRGRACHVKGKQNAPSTGRFDAAKLLRASSYVPTYSAE